MTSISKAAVIKVYNWYAPYYDLLFGRVLEAGRIAMAKIVADSPPERLLEVGVGTGLSLPHYPSEVPTCGIDISLEMLRRAAGLVEQRQLDNVTLLAADAEALPFPDGSFDCITLPYVLSVTPHPERLLAELRRVGIPGGRILVLNHFKGAGVWQVLERLMAPLADRVGFRSNLTMEVLQGPEWRISDVHSVNLFGLSKLIELRNSGE